MNENELENHEIEFEPNEATLKSIEELESGSFDDDVPQEQGVDFELSDDARKAMIYLASNAVVDRSENKEIFSEILQYRERIGYFMHAFNASMIIDEKLGLIYLDVKEDEVPSLFTRRTLSVYDTLLLLQLRKYHLERTNAGERLVVISLDKLESMMLPFAAITNRESQGKKTLSGRIEKMLKPYKLLRNIRNSEERFEIRPLICHIVNAEFLNAMLQEYEALLVSDKQNLP